MSLVGVRRRKIVERQGSKPGRRGKASTQAVEEFRPRLQSVSLLLLFHHLSFLRLFTLNNRTRASGSSYHTNQTFAFSFFFLSTTIAVSAPPPPSPRPPALAVPLPPPPAQHYFFFYKSRGPKQNTNKVLLTFYNGNKTESGELNPPTGLFR